MHLIRFYTITLLYIIAIDLQAQLRPEWNVPSPDVAAMSTFGSVPVSLYTGTPDVSILKSATITCLLQRVTILLR